MPASLPLPHPHVCSSLAGICLFPWLGGRNANSSNWRSLFSEGPFTLCSIRLMEHKLINSQNKSISIRFVPNSNESLPAKTLASARSINTPPATCYECHGCCCLTARQPASPGPQRPISFLNSRRPQAWKDDNAMSTKGAACWRMAVDMVEGSDIFPILLIRKPQSWKDINGAPKLFLHTRDDSGLMTSHYAVFHAWLLEWSH